MSSKIYGNGDNTDTAPMTWRPMGTPSPGTAPSETQQHATHQRAFEEGKAAAQEAARQNAAAQLAPVIANLRNVIQELAGERKRFRMEAEEATVQLAIAIAGRVLHREISTDPEAILGLVRAGYDRLNARETHRLRVSSGDAAIIQQHRDALQLPPAVEIAADASLAPGSAVFETTRGELDASAFTQLDEIQRGFADIVRRRKQ